MVVRLQARTHGGVDAMAALRAIPARMAVGWEAKAREQQIVGMTPAPAAGIQAVGAIRVRTMAAASTRQAFRGGPRDVCCMSGGGG
ncbi:TPA: hypothetical protein QDZ42_003343 [Stenotrophomonas maltophilia]|nr:hypothetical protein [Stenotrophomonas maltophilia]HDS1044664.1 hypothetical protein [Stenotrophomonas maltophilia]